MQTKKTYTTEEYNVLYANTLAYLRFGQKKFIYLFCQTQNRNNKEAHLYLNTIKDFIKNYDLSIENTLKRIWFYQKNYYGWDIEKNNFKK